MATSNERQAAYRARRSTAGDNGERRLQAWVSTAADLALDRLARHHGVSRRVMLERLILAADEQAGREMDDAGFAGYMGVAA
ncbi:MAG TPA: hypothetical protein VJ001_16270 [Rhodocyclaceae bacterium]|nr:hypothetical protein [Rhodocyclaceae bacterium]